MYTPQDLLDQIHESEILELAVRNIPTKTERLNHIKLARQKLRIIKSNLRDTQDSIKARWDGRRPGEGEKEREELFPYQLIEQIIQETEIALRELELDPTTVMPRYGSAVYGDASIGYWAVGSELEAQIWMNEQMMKRSVETAKAIKSSVMALRKSSQLFIDAAYEDISGMHEELKSKKKLLLGLIILIIGTPLAIVLVGWIIFFGIGSSVELKVVMVIALGIIPLTGVEEIREWSLRRQQLRRSITELENEINETRRDMAQSTSEGENTRKELKAAYDESAAKLRVLKMKDT